MRLRPRRCGNLLLTTAVLGALATAVAGCKTGLGDITGSTGALSGGLFGGPSSKPDSITDWRREAAAAGERYRANPRDANAALRYAEALRKTGQRAQAVAVLQQASIHHPHDKRILGDYGRALAEAGQLKEAFEMLGRAHTPDQPDWRILSAQGAVLDQMGQHEEARRYYAAALKIVPDEPSVLSNLGLSYALSKQLPQAEETLRKAVARGGKDRRVRQNLALVVGLQGRFPEAEEIVRADLPPEEAAQNIAYLREMVAKQGAVRAEARAEPSHDSQRGKSLAAGGAGRHAAPQASAQPAPVQAVSRPLALGAGG